MPFLVSRRRTLASAAALAGMRLLPDLEAFAQPAATPPLRLVLWFTPHGTAREEWLPRGGERDFTFGRVLEPLTPWRSKLLVLDGVGNHASGIGFGGHDEGMTSLWTGGRPGPSSIDQVLADRLGMDAPFASLEFGVKVPQPDKYNRMIYRAGQFVHPMNSPYDAFERVFSKVVPTAGSAGAAEFERLRLDQRSIIDFVKADLDRLRASVSVSDRMRLDAHLESVRSIETRLARPAARTSCDVPMLGTQIDVQANDSFPAVGQLQMDLLATSLGCNLTRFASMQWSAGLNGGGIVHRWVGATDNHHNISHQGKCGTNGVGGRCNEQAKGEEGLIRINNWYAKQLAHFLGRLHSIPEGAGSVLDNTLVVWGSEIAAGNHSSWPIPLVLAGGAAGRLQMGRFLRLGGATAGSSPSNNDLALTLAQVLGVKLTSFGDGRYAKGPIGAVLS